MVLDRGQTHPNYALSLDRPRQHQIYLHCHHRFFFFLQVCCGGVSDRQFPARAAAEEEEGGGGGGGGGEAVIITGNFPIVPSNVRSAGASVAGSISGAPDDLHNSTSDWKTERCKEIIKSGTLTSAACWVVRCYLLHGNLGWIHSHALNLWCFYDCTACAAQQRELNNQLKQ
ncbi:hypothetical protein ACSBR1_025785 [Camellia fascicularis]